MQGLSYGVVRVDSENSLTSLTLQDCGQVMPGGKLSALRFPLISDDVLPSGEKLPPFVFYKTCYSSALTCL